MSNKDFLKLENEFRNDLPVYKEKPKITSMPKPDKLTSRVSEFLKISKQAPEPKKSSDERDDRDKLRVEMDILAI